MEHIDIPEAAKEGDRCPAGDGGTLKLRRG